MAEVYKNLGQVALSSASLTDIYTVPAATSAVVSSIIVCNRGASATTFRLSMAIAGAADAVGQYLYYDQAIEGNSSYVATLGLTLAATDKIRASIANSTGSVNIFGSEVT